MTPDTTPPSAKEVYEKRVQIIKDGMSAASWRNCSEHEWKWSQKEQEKMALALLLLAENVTHALIHAEAAQNGGEEIQAALHHIISNLK